MTPPRRAQRTVPMVAGVVGLIAVALIVMLANASPSDGETASSPLLGRAAPAVQSTTLDGDPFDVSRRRGSWVMLNFFNSTCVPCIQEHGALQDFVAAQTTQADAVEFFTIINDDNDDAVRSLFKANGGDWPKVKDSDGAISVAFGVAKVPETWIIDRMGLCGCELLAELNKVFLKIESPNYVNNLKAHHDDVNSK